MSKKSILSVFFVSLASLVLYFIYSSSLEQRVAPENSSAKTVAKLAKGQASSRAVESKKNLLSLDVLLDDTDKTLENEAKIINHSNIIKGLITVRFFSENGYENIQKEDLMQLLQTLVLDSYYTNELGLGNSPSNPTIGVTSIDADLIPDPDNLSRFLKKDYVEFLRENVKRASNTLGSDMETNEIKAAFIPLAESLLRRKAHSDVSFNFLLRKYLLSNNFSVQEKTTFVEEFLLAGDFGLAKRALEFFHDGAVKVDTSEDSRLIEMTSEKIVEELRK
ncbi:MAG: hypothetical protein ACI9SP_004642 [Arenicella sp.]|jgi:hypothetical protein